MRSKVGARWARCGFSIEGLGCRGVGRLSKVWAFFLGLETRPSLASPAFRLRRKRVTLAGGPNPREKALTGRHGHPWPRLHSAFGRNASRLQEVPADSRKPSLGDAAIPGLTRIPPSVCAPKGGARVQKLSSSAMEQLILRTHRSRIAFFTFAFDSLVA